MRTWGGRGEGPSVPVHGQGGAGDPEGGNIENPAVVEWLSEKGFTQDNINALGKDAAATAKLYECYLGNCDFRTQDAGASLDLTAISVSNDVVSITVQLTRKAPLGAINGVLNFYGADALADGFGSSPIAKGSVSFGADDAKFATTPTTGSVTQTATATFSYISYKFFKASITPFFDSSSLGPILDP